MTPVVALPQPTVERVDRAQRVTVARLCAAAFLAYSSYAICRTPLLPLFARELGGRPGGRADRGGYLIAGGGFDRAFLAAGVIGLATPLIVSRWPHAGHTPVASARLDHFRRGVSEILRWRCTRSAWP
jgi:hypothetical protein